MGEDRKEQRLERRQGKSEGWKKGRSEGWKERRQEDERSREGANERKMEGANERRQGGWMEGSKNEAILHHPPYLPTPMRFDIRPSIRRGQDENNRFAAIE